MSAGSRIGIIAAVVLAVAAGAGGYLFYERQQAPDPTAAGVGVPEQRPAFTLPDLGGEPRAITDWDGKVVLLNFWASWCPPCRREIPAFIDLQADFGPEGFTVVGVAIDEKQAVVDFVDPLGVNYPVLMGDRGGIEIAEAYGNRLGVLPYSVLIDRDGRIVATYRHELDYAEVEKAIRPLL
jgi:thiol-disulfide isomerase/thioredoxin